MIHQDNRSRSRDAQPAADPGHSIESTRLFAENQRNALLSLDHRIRNNLAALLTLIDLARHDAPNVESFAGSISAKVRVLGSAYTLYSRSGFRSVDLHEFTRAMLPMGLENRVEVIGEPVEIPMRQAFALGLVLSTLLSRSASAGALSSEHGSVRVEASEELQDNEQRTLELLWHEGGGPVENLPAAEIRLLEGLVKYELRGGLELGFSPEEANHRIKALLDRIEAE